MEYTCQLRHFFAKIINISTLFINARSLPEVDFFLKLVLTKQILFNFPSVILAGTAHTWYVWPLCD